MKLLLKRFLFIQTFLSMLLAANKPGQPIEKSRDLASCSSYTEGESCNLDSNCNFLANVGGGYDTTTLSNQDFNKETEYSYGNGLVKDEDYIYMSKVGFSIDLYAHSNASSTVHPLGEWKILFRTNYDIYIDITRDPANNEEFYSYANTNQQANFHYSKYFANCESSTYRLILSNTGYIRLKVNKLNNASNYSITVSQPYDENLNWTAIILSIGGVTICISLIILVILIWLSYRAIKRSEANNARKILPEQKIKLEFIAKGLKNMESGPFTDMDLKFEESACVICLEDYFYDSIVSITNEGNHVFHSKGLDEWFRNIRCDKDLVCPHCNTVITDISEKPPLRGVDISSDNIPDTENGLNTINGTTNNMILTQILQSINRSSGDSREIDEEEEKDNSL